MKSIFTFSRIIVVFFLLSILSNSQAQLVSTFAGSTTSGSADGTGTSASFAQPAGVATDASGNVYVADFANCKIRKITPAGVVTTLAGAGTPGSTDGTGASASFNNPAALAVDGTGNIFVADYGSHKIRKVTPAGVVTTIAGSGTPGSSDGTGSAASFSYPWGITVDASGNLYVSEIHRIRKITTSGVVTTMAGSASSGSVDGQGTSASFYFPRGLAVDATGNIYVADFGNQKIRKITPSGSVSTFAGTGAVGALDGPAASATFTSPISLTINPLGIFFVAERDGYRIRKISPAGSVSTIAGSGSQGSSDGMGAAASFYSPVGITNDGISSLYVCENFFNHAIRKIALLPEIKISQGSTELVSGLGTYNFGSVNALSSSGAVTFAIENAASAERELSLTGSPKVSVSGANASEFSVNTSNTISPVAVGSTTNFTITFIPTSGGSKSATITVLNNDVDEGTYTFTVTGTGIKLNQSISGLSNISATYGDAPLNLSATSSSGLTLSYNSSNTSVATVSGNVLTIIGAGTSTITASQAGNTTYNAASNATSSLTVSKAFLDIVADNKTKVQGAANPPLTITYSGFVDSDNETVLGCIPSPQTTATTSSPAGNYPITVSNCGFTNTNYNYTFSGGTLTVTTATSNDKEIEVSLFSVSPNPSAGSLTLESKVDLNVKIMNAQGLIVIENNLSTGNNTLSLEMLAPGLYIFRAMDVHGNVQEQRIIRN